MTEEWAFLVFPVRLPAPACNARPFSLSSRTTVNEVEKRLCTSAKAQPPKGRIAGFSPTGDRLVLRPPVRGHGCLGIHVPFLCGAIIEFRVLVSQRFGTLNEKSLFFANRPITTPLHYVSKTFSVFGALSSPTAVKQSLLRPFIAVQCFYDLN
jgi:hypothetical protein